MTRVHLAVTAGVLLGLAVAIPSIAQDAPSTEAPLLEPEQVVGAPAGPLLGGDALDEAAAHVGSLLRCPVCQGLSVNDSPATMAVNMKTQVRDMLSRGYTEEQILSYFEGSYGEFVRLEPPLRGVNWLVWVAPLAALLVGGVVVARTLRARGQAETEGEPEEASRAPARGTLPDDPELARYVRRARELAYGWPEGTPPGEES